MSAPRRHLFLDLEDTVITPVLTGWFATQPMNIEKVKAFIHEFKPDAVHIFSFAIWDEHQKQGFQQGTQPWLEKLLGVKFGAVPTVDDDIIPAVCKVLGIAREKMDFSDLSDFFGKHDGFRLNMRNLFKNNSSPVELAFLDDAVYNESFEWPDLQVKGRIINIDQMKEPNGNPESQP